MSLHVNVPGGTGAGWRRRRERPEWRCKCKRRSQPHGTFVVRRVHPGATYSCPTCGVRNPNAEGRKP